MRPLNFPQRSSDLLVSSFFLLNAMAPLRLIGYAGSCPCVFSVDLASPRSEISRDFLFRHSIPTNLDASGALCTHLTVSVPSQGGYYTSTNLLLVSSTGNNADVVLGSGWIASCNVRFATNVLLKPAIADVLSLPDVHKWSPDGKRFLELLWVQAHKYIPVRNLPYSLLHEREDQCCFSMNISVPLYGPYASTSSQARFNTTPVYRGYTLEGSHNQAAFDKNCQMMETVPSVPSEREYVKYRDMKPDAHVKSLFGLLKKSLFTEDINFWACVLHEHNVEAVMTDVSDYRRVFIQHVFGGGCAE